MESNVLGGIPLPKLAPRQGTAYRAVLIVGVSFSK